MNTINEDNDYYEFDLDDVFKNCNINNPLDEFHYINKLTLSLYGYSIRDIEFIDGNIRNLTRQNLKFKN